MDGVFRLPLRDKPWPLGLHEPRGCPVCGGYWKPWAGSRLPCHARCLFTDDARAVVRSDPRCDAEIARHYGVTMSVVRAVRR